MGTSGASESLAWSLQGVVVSVRGIGTIQDLYGGYKDYVDCKRGYKDDVGFILKHYIKTASISFSIFEGVISLYNPYISCLAPYKSQLVVKKRVINA